MNQYRIASIGLMRTAANAGMMPHRAPDTRGDGDASDGGAGGEGRGVAQGDVERLEGQETHDDDRDAHTDNAGDERSRRPTP